MKKLFIPPVIVLISVFLIVCFFIIIPRYNIIPFPFNLIGIIISFVGFTIMGKSRDLYRKHQTTLGFERSSLLITDGIYSRTRNPMYVGMFLLLLGLGICFENLFSILTPFIFLVLAMVYYIPMEEKMLSGRFGEEYEEYKKRVRRWY